MTYRIRRLTVDDEALVLASSHLFDGPARADATRRFLAEPTHHMLVALDGDGRAVGFVSGVELTHPDKGTDMFLNELDVEETHQRQGIGRSLTEALAQLARERGCGVMWVGTENDNDAALATYRSAGASEEEQFVMLTWELGDT
jgi:ribosomal protein S18 acetylase RimI-like enzyme